MLVLENLRCESLSRHISLKKTQFGKGTVRKLQLGNSSSETSPCKHQLENFAQETPLKKPRVKRRPGNYVFRPDSSQDNIQSDPTISKDAVLHVRASSFMPSSLHLEAPFPECRLARGARAEGVFHHDGHSGKEKQDSNKTGNTPILPRLTDSRGALDISWHRHSATRSL